MQTKQALKSEILKPKSELRKAQGKLIETAEELELYKRLEYFYHDRFEHYKEKCAILEAENSKLKREIKKLELEKKAIKSVQIAHQNYNRKEA